jgi:hypothetical protein
METDRGPPEPAGPVQAGSEQGATNAAALSGWVDSEHADGGLVVLEQLGPRGGGIGDESDAPDQPVVNRDENLGFTGSTLDIGKLPGVAIRHMRAGQSTIRSEDNGTRLFVVVRPDLTHFHPADPSSPCSGRVRQGGGGDLIRANNWVDGVPSARRKEAARAPGAAQAGGSPILPV